jgi:hypothetical protein
MVLRDRVCGVGPGFRCRYECGAKSYQFTGSVTAADSGTLTVQKSAKEIWTFSTDKDTKGTAKVGDKVTVYYNMVATQIEAKARAGRDKEAREVTASLCVPP